MTTDITAIYTELRNLQKETIALLKPANTELKRMQAVRKAQGLEGAALKEWKADFRVKKDYQLSIVHKLADVNAELKVIRPQYESSKGQGKKEKKPKVIDSTKELMKQQKIERRQALKDAKEAERKENNAVKLAEREAKKEAERLAREKRREERAEELEAKGKPARGYTFPLLTETESKMSHFLEKEVFGKMRVGA